MSDTQDRTERATPKRLREARERGEVPRSRELASAIVVGSAVLALFAMGSSLAAGASAWMQRALSPAPEVLRDSSLAGVWFAGLVSEAYGVVLPLLVIGVLAAVAGPLMLGGWNLSWKALQPDFNRINPVSGLGRVFSSQALMELGKGLLKAFLLGAIAWIFVQGHTGELLALGRESPERATAHGLTMALLCLAWLSGGLLLIALVDAPFQLWSYAKRLRMSRQEIREEYKQTEGSPETKGRIRRAQQEMSRRRMMEKVPQADVILVNPTHYAVALQYKAGEMAAPRVIAKGVDEIAAAIREKAAEHRIPIVSAPPLARALYRGTRLDQEIPMPLYAAVAQVLTYVYRLRQWAGGTPPPTLPEIGDVPGGEPDPS
ncbi:MAG TPA: flagellar biosynthesis protein FlhB [Solimonas sp.]|nr:flagellar biosynthesis protein FlhB [Solimonas sp.]